MKLKMKKLLSLIFAGLTLAGCSTIKPVGHIDLAYVPSRYDDKPEKHEIMTELDLGLKAELDKASLIIGGSSRTYMNFNKLMMLGFIPIPTFMPNRQEYDFDINFKRNNWEIYFEHMCSHPVVNETEFTIPYRGEDYLINHDDITKLGVRWSF